MGIAWGSPGGLDTTFGALADPTRRAILARLAREGETPVSDLAQPFAMSLPAISKHIRVLEQAGLVVREKRGRTYYCRLMPAPLREADEWIGFYRRFWTAKLDSLEAYLEREERSPDDSER